MSDNNTISKNTDSKGFINQIFPIVFAVFIFALISFGLFGWVKALNLFPGEKILLNISWADILVGLTIYLKTAVDFALIIGILMKNFPGLKNRIAIETGTAFGNALGTALILLVWYFFKEIQWLLSIMVILASFVLFKLAKSSLEHVFEDQEAKDLPVWLVKSTHFLESILNPINKFLNPLLSKIVPEMSFNAKGNEGFWSLVVASFTIPFILGLDDFAGYVPLFSVINVLGFGIGVFLGHCILNIFLFLNPKKTIEIVKNPIVAILGSLAFIGLATWGLYEAIHILIATYLH
jgi:hypothetical protein